MGTRAIVVAAGSDDYMEDIRKRQVVLALTFCRRTCLHWLLGVYQTGVSQGTLGRDRLLGRQSAQQFFNSRTRSRLVLKTTCVSNANRAVSGGL
jgi:hypothetical protein